MPASKAARPSVAPFETISLEQVLRRTAQRLPAKEAVIDGQRRFTFADLDRHSDALAAALAGLGLRQGDRVALLAPNCAEFVIAFYAAIKAGGVVTPVNAAYREQEIAHQINDSQASVLIAHELFVPAVLQARGFLPTVRQVISIGQAPAGAHAFWDLVSQSHGAPPRVAIDPRSDLATLPYSSGTTGLAKGVMLTHYNLTSNLRQCLLRQREASVPRQDDVVIVHLPMFHIYGLNILMNASIAAGATQVLMGRFDMEQFLSLIARHRVTMMFTVPPVILGLTQYPGVRNHDLSSVRMCLSGAAPLSADLQARLEQVLGIPTIQGYGLTETSPLTNVDFIEPDLRRSGSVGPVVADTEEKIVDVEDSSKELPRGGVGELLIRGPQVMKGYYNNPEATRQTIDAQGWLHSGDIARIDADGYLWILDRKKELIKYKGFQVAPAELEALLLKHPGVADAAVIAKHDAEAGEVPKAFIVRRPGASPSADELMHFVAGKVATYKQLREVEFLDAVPKNPSGKILRRVLVERERAKSQRSEP